MSGLDQFKATYITECYELLEEMEEKLLGLDGQTADKEELNAIFRCAHSIKGGGGAFGFEKLVQFTHVVEFLLDAMREGKISPTRNVVDALLRSVDVINQMVSAAKEGKEPPVNCGQDLIPELQRLVSNTGSAHVPAVPSASAAVPEDGEISKFFDISFKPHKALFENGNEPLLILRELSRAGNMQVKVDTSAVPPLAELNPMECFLSWHIEMETEKGESAIREAFEFVEGECDLEIRQTAGVGGRPIVPLAKPAEIKTDAASPKVTEAASTAQREVSSIRVDLDKVDRLVNMVGELVITQAMIQAQVKDLPPEKFTKLIAAVEELSQHTRELQESVMSVRMQPVKSIFSRMPRIVRDLSRQLEKDIVIEMHGENTEIDKTVIEQLGDPLTHMIRNSVDHGIERPADRMAAGKPAQGVIRLSADHRGGRIVIEISDDGKGINRERVLAKAKEKGLLAADAQPTNEEIDHLIFHAGFSTAEQVTNVSGRGVGMDVVRRNIESLGGTVDLLNKPGQGTEFAVTLPLTLAILDGMITRVGTEQYIIPIGNIIETLRPRAGEVSRVADGGDVISVRGEFIPVLYLSRVFSIQGAVTEPTRGLVVLVENGRNKFGILVDELLGQQQVVIKSIEENADPVEGISGATILGDGNVSLILDVAGLHKSMGNNNSPRRAPQGNVA